MAHSRLRAQYEDHGVWVLLGQISETLHDADLATDDETEADKVEIIETSIATLKMHSSYSSPIITSPILDELQNHLMTVHQRLAEWKANNYATAHLDNAVVAVAPAVKMVMGWPNSKDKYLRGAIQASEAFQEDSRQSMTELERRTDELITEFRAQVDTLTGELTEVRAAVDRAASHVDTSVTSFDTSYTEAAARVNTQVERLDSALNSLQETFAKSEESRTKQFADSLAEIEENADENLKAQLTAAEEHVEKIRDYEKQVEKLVNAVGLTGTATEYGTYANQQQRAANSWRWIASAAFAASFVALVITLIVEPVTRDTPWQFVAIRLGISVALLAFGAYAARESTQHRREERSAKDKQLDLAALDPFIVTLDEDERKRIKADAAKRLFVDSQRRPKEDGGGPALQLDAKQVVDLVEGVVSRLRAT